jgi:hypothetical protein
VAETPLPPHLLDVVWVHSHEEDTPTETVFRPAGWKFPPARGRRSMRLLADGGLVEGQPGPDDRPTTVATARWHAPDARHVEVFRGVVPPAGAFAQPAGVAGKPDRVLEIASVTKDRLVVRKPAP